MKYACVSIALLAVAAPCASGAQAAWDDQLLEMEYLLLHISTVNAINGLGLDRGQAVELRRMARQVEAAGARVPSPRGTFRPDLAEVRDTYRQLERLVRTDQPVPDDMKRRVAQARLLEAAVIRASLRDPSSATPSEGCTRCHVPPTRTFRSGEVDLAGMDRPGTRRGRSRSPTDAGVFRAHLLGLYGVGGARTLIQLAPRVNRLLTGPQRSIVETFSCCLVPPQELSDPVRAGQAETNTRVLKLLRYVRSVPASRWPVARKRVLDLASNARLMYRPGLSDAQKADARRRVAEVLEEARRMSDVDFEIEKDVLARRLDWRTSQDDSPRWDAKSAMFLLLPGTAPVYTDVIKRIAAKSGGANRSGRRRAPNPRKPLRSNR